MSKPNTTPFGEVAVGQLVRVPKTGFVYRKLADSCKGAGRAEFVEANDAELVGKECSFNRRNRVEVLPEPVVPTKRKPGRPRIYSEEFKKRGSTDKRIKNPVEYCWQVFAAFEAERPGNYKRKDVLKVLSDAGVAFNTARTQWGIWKTVLRKSQRERVD